MKLVKLSLIAAMAAGVVATTASAVPLDEVVKDIDVSGYTRLRYTYDKTKHFDDTRKDGEKSVKDTSPKWNFKGVLNVKTKIDDNFFTVVGIRYDDTDLARERQEHKKPDGSLDRISYTGASKPGNFELSKAYFGYAVGNTVVQLGRQDLGTFFTDDMYGDGIKVLNSDIPGLTLAALWMDSLEYDGDIATRDIEVNGRRTVDNNLWGVAAIGSFDPVSFQVWYAGLENVTDLFAVEGAFSFDIIDDVNINAKLQYAFSDFDSKFKGEGGAPVDDADFYGIELGTEFFGADLTAGYVDFSTKKNKLSLVSFEDQGSFISPGEELLDYTLFAGKNNYWFVTAGYTIPNTGLRIGADYLRGKNKVDVPADDVDNSSTMSEVVARIEYAHSDKLKFQTWYSHVTRDVDYLVDSNPEKIKNDRVRFEAKYSF